MGDESDGQASDNRQFAPATARNREAILEVLNRVLPAEGTVLEIGSGSGEHAAFFAPRLAPRRWLPSDPSPDKRASIKAWRQERHSTNLGDPVAIDTSEHRWPVEQAVPSPRITAIVSINMIHIAPWRAALGLFAGAGRILGPDDILYLYGPFREQGKRTAASNEKFDDWLRAEDPDWGVRDLEEVVDAAAAQGFGHDEVVEMPANNLSVIFRRIL